jgi:hypothetical protein
MEVFSSLIRPLLGCSQFQFLMDDVHCGRDDSEEQSRSGGKKSAQDGEREQREQPEQSIILASLPRLDQAGCFFTSS